MKLGLLLFLLLLGCREELYYGDSVVATKGFWKGCTGTLEDYHWYADRCFVRWDSDPTGCTYWEWCANLKKSEGTK